MRKGVDRLTPSQTVAARRKALKPTGIGAARITGADRRLGALARQSLRGPIVVATPCGSTHWRALRRTPFAPPQWSALASVRKGVDRLTPSQTVAARRSPSQPVAARRKALKPTGIGAARITGADRRLGALARQSLRGPIVVATPCGSTHWRALRRTPFAPPQWSAPASVRKGVDRLTPSQTVAARRKALKPTGIGAARITGADRRLGALARQSLRGPIVVATPCGSTHWRALRRTPFAPPQWSALASVRKGVDRLTPSQTVAARRKALKPTGIGAARITGADRRPGDPRSKVSEGGSSGPPKQTPGALAGVRGSRLGTGRRMA